MSEDNTENPNQESPQPEQPDHQKPAADIVSKNITRRPPNVIAQATKKDDEAPSEAIDRRSFIKWLAIGWGAFAAAIGGYLTLMLRFMFPNVLFEPKQSFDAGLPDDYTIGEVSERFKAQHGVWIVRDFEKIYALSTVCTHLGCTPNWLGSEAKFKCPCHGSGFYKTGINFEGPAPRPLERFKIVLSDDGEIVVDKTKKFQQEKGEWSDPESFILT